MPDYTADDVRATIPTLGWRQLVAGLEVSYLALRRRYGENGVTMLIAPEDGVEGHYTALVLLLPDGEDMVQHARNCAIIIDRYMEAHSEWDKLVARYDASKRS